MIDAAAIDLKDSELAQVRRILAEYLPGWEVRAFGSRVAGRAKPWSDLDLAVAGPEPVGWNRLGRIFEAFQESELPFRVDILDWHNLSPAFRQVIEREFAVIQQGQTRHRAG